MAERSLDSVVAEIIQPYTTSIAKPPFTDGQAITFMLCLEGCPLTLEDVLERIVANLRYYRTKLVKEVVNRHSGQDFFESFQAALREYDCIVRVGEDKELSVTQSSIRLAVAPFLPPTPINGLAPSAAGSRFLDLPPELRNMVYTMVLAFPTSGIRPREWKHTKEFQMLAHDLDDTNSVKDWAGRSDQHLWDHALPVHSRPLRTVLALLRTSREIFNEAMPIFYNINTFHAPDMNELKNLLTRVSPDRRDNMKTISFIYQAPQRRRAVGIFNILATMTHLKSVNMWFSESQWTGYKVKGAPAYNKPSDYDGIKTLVFMCRQLNVLSLEGTCDGLAAYLKKEIRSQKSFKLLVNGQEVALGQEEVTEKAEPAQ